MITLEDLKRILVAMQRFLRGYSVVPEEERATREPSGYFYLALVMAEFKVSEYDVFIAALQRDSLTNSVVDEELDELYDWYARGGGLPDAVSTFCREVYTGKKPYIKSDGTSVMVS